MTSFIGHDPELGNISVLTVSSIKMRVFWDVAPCSMVDFGRRFGGAYYFYYEGDLHAF
jgi:hypothetical protein